MGMFVHGDNDEKAFYDEQSALETLGMYPCALEYTKTEIIAPPTHKDVLLKTWAQDTEAMAEAMVHKSSSGGWYALKTDNSILDWYKAYPEAIAAEIAYLNSAAEVGK